MPSTPHRAWTTRRMVMRTRVWALAGAIAVTAALGLGTGLATAQTEPSGPTTAPTTSSTPTADATEAMNTMHEAMRAQMPEELRAEADAMHAEMGRGCIDMAAAMGSMTAPEGPPA